jgi:hypothetical protein
MGDFKCLFMNINVQNAMKNLSVLYLVTIQSHAPNVILKR